MTLDQVLCGPLRFAGYAALFGIRDAGGDVIRKGAFARTLAEQRQPISLFWQHRPELRAGEFAGHRPGSQGFSNVWRQIARRDSASLHTAEHAFVKRNHFDPAAAMIRNATRLDLDHVTPALRDVLWSSAVQHGKGSPTKKLGGATKIFIDAITRTDATISRNAPMYDEHLIRNIYGRRTAYWPSDRPRYQSEMQNALRGLGSE